MITQQEYNKQFVVSNASGAAVDANALPVATASVNGTDDPTFLLTVTKIDVGRYNINGVIPSSYTGRDIVNIYISASVGAPPVAAKSIVDTFEIEDLSGPTITRVVGVDSDA